eukprot:8559784-Alexandrium_andersonii.AAC.1
MEPVDGSGCNRKRPAPEGSGAAGGTAKEATSASGEICADLPEGVAKLIDLGGHGECGWPALSFASARSLGKPDGTELREATVRAAKVLHART